MRPAGGSRSSQSRTAFLDGHPNRGAKPERATASPEPPTIIGAYARGEWWRVGPELQRLGLLTVLDVAPLATDGVAYDRWRTAEEVLAVMRKRDEDTSTHD